MAVIEELNPPHELQRLAAVRRYEILDTPPDGAFDRITALAARLFQVPIAVVSVVDTDRIWFKSRHGLPGTEEIGRDPGLCASAILQAGPWVVTDAAADPRTLANPLVAGELGLRFYAGAPLRTSDGYNLGTLCVIDREPRAVSAEEAACLQDLAAVVVDELELRLAARRTVATEGRRRREAEALADTLQRSLLPPQLPAVPGIDLASRFVAGETGLSIGGDFFDVFGVPGGDWAIVIGDACGRGAVPAALAASVRWTVRACGSRVTHPSRALAHVNTILLDDGDADDHFCSALLVRLTVGRAQAEATFATAGHPLPMLVRTTGAVHTPGAGSLPLGLFADLGARDHRARLGPGDALVLYTDGITEARDTTGTQFGEQRLIQVLRRCAGATSAVLADAAVQAATDFADGSLDDDAAVLVIRVPCETAAPGRNGVTG